MEGSNDGTNWELYEFPCKPSRFLFYCFHFKSIFFFNRYSTEQIENHRLEGLDIFLDLTGACGFFNLHLEKGLGLKLSFSVFSVETTPLFSLSCIESLSHLTLHHVLFAIRFDCLNFLIGEAKIGGKWVMKLLLHECLPFQLIGNVSLLLGLLDREKMLQSQGWGEITLCSLWSLHFVSSPAFAVKF